MVVVEPSVTLHGFNNLSKTLSMSIFDICYARTPAQVNEYLAYIDEVYDADRLTRILTEVTEMIGANILNVARQDYEPQGASVTILIAEEPVITEGVDCCQKEPELLAVEGVRESVVAHLDKSHITVHTYPESHPESGISTFRADIDVSTCGRISPLRALNYLIHSLDSDIVTLDYRVRGFTRDVHGKKHFIDHKINSIQSYLAEDIRERYQMIDVNVYQENIFHTKMLLKEFDLDNYLFGHGRDEYSPEGCVHIEKALRKEMYEIFYGRNLSDADIPSA
ncbi:MAG TPA: adenosylmethionine decarboxylase [Guyparkeria sp.]|nr:adenosylmethionine decarboxylase [Guyparkeria sp.]